MKANVNAVTLRSGTITQDPTPSPAQPTEEDHFEEDGDMAKKEAKNEEPLRDKEREETTPDIVEKESHATEKT